MKIDNVNYPKSSFLSMEKDTSLIVRELLKNQRFKKLLKYTTNDALQLPDLTEEESVELMHNNIKFVPKLTVDGSVRNYIIVNFDNFSPNATNPEFRDNFIEFDIICHFDQWTLHDFQLRPYRIAAEIDSMFNDKHLTGIGRLEFFGASQIILTDEYAGLCLMYAAIHGEEDKKDMLNPVDQQKFIEDFVPTDLK